MSDQTRKVFEAILAHPPGSAHRIARQALDAQPVEPVGYFILDEGVHFQVESWVTGSFPLYAATPSLAPDAQADPQLLRFYQVADYQGLVTAMERHIARLQAKVTRDDQPAFTRVRES